MKEHPIIFSTDMVKAILDGRKTQTRRTNGLDLINKSRLLFNSLGEVNVPSKYEDNIDNKRWHFEELGGMETVFLSCPYGQVGDRLWVRETWQVVAFSLMADAPKALKVAYKADDSTKVFQVDFKDWHKYSSVGYDKWKPSIFMPRWASRINLEITEVRVERVQEITERDAMAEGVTAHPELNTDGWRTTVDDFKDLWDSLNAKRGFGWTSNCWVWVISFNKE